MEITYHTGAQDERGKINIDWFDENGVKRKDILRINVKPQDKPREIEILINGTLITTLK